MTSRRLLGAALALALAWTGPVFAEGSNCRTTGIRRGQEMVVGERKRFAWLLTVDEAASAVGVYDVDLLREIADGRLRHSVVGGHWMIHPDDLEAWRRSSWAIRLVDWRARGKTTQLPWKTDKGTSGDARGHRGTLEDTRGHRPLDKGSRTDAMAAGVTQTDSDSPWRTRQEAACRAGVKPKTISRWVRTGRLEVRYTPGGKPRFLDAWIDAAMDAPDDAADDAAD